MRYIVTAEDPVLRTRAGEVKSDDIQTNRIKEIICDMKDAMAKEKFGVAIAAPQVGESLRIFVVAGKAMADRTNQEYSENVHTDLVCINPEVTKISKKIKTGDEGCLSIPGKYGTKVDRHDKISITYYNEAGEKKERGASGFLARVFQHEIDHLNGVLYTDIATEVIDVDENLKPFE
jgi:peptide deformylase